MHRPVLCPMGHEMEAFRTAGGGWRYGCTACGTRKGNGHYGWISPLRSTKDLAYMAAQKRPTQRPLMLDEAANADYCWIETRNGYYVEPCNIGSPHLPYMPHTRPVYLIGTSAERPNMYPDSGYGSVWRCWAEKPTDTERQAAKWEDENGGTDNGTQADKPQ